MDVFTAVTLQKTGAKNKKSRMSQHNMLQFMLANKSLFKSVG